MGVYDKKFLLDDAIAITVDAYTSHEVKLPHVNNVAPMNWGKLKRSERKRKAKQTVTMGELQRKDVALEGPRARMAA